MITSEGNGCWKVNAMPRDSHRTPPPTIAKDNENKIHFQRTKAVSKRRDIAKVMTEGLGQLTRIMRRLATNYSLKDMNDESLLGLNLQNT